MGQPQQSQPLVQRNTQARLPPARCSLDPADEALCNDCGTCYQELPQFFARTTVVIDGEARVIARMIPGAAESVDVTPELAKRIERVEATCDAEILR